MHFFASVIIKAMWLDASNAAVVCCAKCSVESMLPGWLRKTPQYQTFTYMFLFTCMKRMLMFYITGNDNSTLIYTRFSLTSGSLMLGFYVIKYWGKTIILISVFYCILHTRLSYAGCQAVSIFNTRHELTTPGKKQTTTPGVMTHGLRTTGLGDLES